MARQKENCRVFTPNEIVIKMLDLLGYKDNLYGCKILENSCGEGAFLAEIVRRYIIDCRNQGFNNDKIKKGLEQDIWGYEKEPVNADCCKDKLNSIAGANGIFDINWNIIAADALKTKVDIKFSYIAGNPPYITYSALDESTRNYLKDNFQVCTAGKPDYYYAFVESALNHLDETGKLIYLIPNNFFKTRFAEKLRQLLLPSLTDIYDYTKKKLFVDALTSSAIIMCDNATSTNSICYHDVLNDNAHQIPKSEMMHRWVLPLDSQDEELQPKRRFGDFFSAASTVATLYNKAFLIENPDEKALAEAVMRLAVSPRSLANKKTEHIIFPYAFKDDKYVRYSEEEFTAQFPQAAAHLKKFKENLNERKSDKSAKWFEFGRSQAIAHMNQQKLLISTLITGRVKIYELDENTIPYAGIYILSKSDLPLSRAKEILESEAFLSYAQRVGIHANGVSMRISVNDVNEFMF